MLVEILFHILHSSLASTITLRTCASTLLPIRYTSPGKQIAQLSNKECHKPNVGDVSALVKDKGILRPITLNNINISNKIK